MKRNSAAITIGALCALLVALVLFTFQVRQTEVAVVTFLLVGIAIVVLGVIYTAAKGNADNIPTPEAPGAAG